MLPNGLLVRLPDDVPELIEVESYRTAADSVVGRRICSIEQPDPTYVKGADRELIGSLLHGLSVLGTGRRGKLMWLELGRRGGDIEHRLGLRFGMTGRLLVDGAAPIAELLYSPTSADAKYTRFTIRFDGGGSLEISDPRRFGSVELDPDITGLGPDAASVTTAELRAAIGTSSRPVKALLLDQSRVAGIGNLLADELLWAARIAPARGVDTLDATEQRSLASAIRATVARLSGRGGSHTGDLQYHRAPGGVCPRCSGRLRRSRVGGRSTVWCPTCQR